MGHEVHDDDDDDYETWATAEGQRESDEVAQRAMDELDYT
jgi:hypothetical protein